VRFDRLAGAAVAIALAACSGGQPAPAGWQPVPGASASWRTGAGASAQRYSYARSAYTGSLHALASQEAVDVVQHYPEAKLVGSDPFLPCPGLAAVETFTLGKHRTLQRALAVQPTGHAVVITYVRPKSTPVDPSVSRALKRALCVTGL
jgi:hypothetical protein